MAEFVFPTSAKLNQIAQDLLPRLEKDRPVFEMFPVLNEDADTLIWEQRDNYIGLQQVRGINGAAPRVKKVGVKRFVMEPGIYGEYIPIEEAELTKRRQIGTFGTPIDLSDLVYPLQDQLLVRRLDRIEWMIWTLATTGTFTVPGPNGAILHTDSYPIRTYTAPVTWATSLTAGPLADFSAVQLLSRGYSVDFGQAAKAYMNRATFNNLRTNTNPADIYGRRTAGLGTFNNIMGINQLLQGDDLPQVVIYDRGYYDDTNTFKLFVPNNTVVVVGKRDAGQSVGNYCYTRNANNADLGPGAVTKVIDNNEREVVRNFSVADLHNGGLKLNYPSALLIMNV